MSRRELALSVPRSVAWAALVAPGRRTWYYHLEPRGAFEPGARLEWVGENGRVAEESEVLEVVPDERLRMRSRFLFAAAHAAAPSHTVTWTLAPSPGGCLVGLEWEGEGSGVRMLESEGQALIAGLRLAADPAARAELERLSEIGRVEVHDVTPERLADYQEFFDSYAFRDYPAWQGCYCMEPVWEGDDDGWGVRTAAENRADMSERVAGGRLTALLAYVNGRPVGWCQFGESTRLANVVRRFGLAPAERRVGSVACFIIDAPYRGHGVASQLLAAALDRLRRSGLEIAEAYPARDRDTPQGNFRGPLEMYLRAGFEPYRETEGHIVVRKELA